MADISTDVEIRSLQTLTAPQIQGVAALWKQQRRRIVTSFQGFSMVPTIFPGAAVEIVCEESASPGDVIVFLNRGEIVVHRLLATRGEWMLTRGDANDLLDPPVCRDAMVGRVTGLYRPEAVESLAGCVESKRQKLCRLTAQPFFNLSPSAASAVFASMRFAYRLLARLGRIAARHARLEKTPSDS